MSWFSCSFSNLWWNLFRLAQILPTGLSKLYLKKIESLWSSKKVGRFLMGEKKNTHWYQTLPWLRHTIYKILFIFNRDHLIQSHWIFISKSELHQNQIISAKLLIKHTSSLGVWVNHQISSWFDKPKIMGVR